VTVLDSYAVIALLRGEPAANRVAELVRDGQARLTVLGVSEVVDHLVRVVGVVDEEAALDLAQLDLTDPPPLAPDLALRAGLLRARHYHRISRAVSLADCVAAEIARTGGSPLATADPHLLELCEDEGIDTVVLPDSRGNTWRA